VINSTDYVMLHSRHKSLPRLRDTPTWTLV